MKMAGSNILTRKQLEKMANDQLIEFAMKLQNNMINEQIELNDNLYDKKEFREKLVLLALNLMSLKKKMKFLRAKYQL